MRQKSLQKIIILHMIIGGALSISASRLAFAQNTLSLESETKSVSIGRGQAPIIDGHLDEF